MNDCLLCVAVVGRERNWSSWAYPGLAGTGCSQETCFRAGGRVFSEEREAKEEWFERDLSHRKAGASSSKPVSVIKIAEVWKTWISRAKRQFGLHKMNFNRLYPENDLLEINLSKLTTLISGYSSYSGRYTNSLQKSPLLSFFKNEAC